MAARQLCWLIVYRDYPYQYIEDCQSPGKSVLKPAVWTQGYFKSAQRWGTVQWTHTMLVGIELSKSDGWSEKFPYVKWWFVIPDFWTSWQMVGDIYPHCALYLSICYPTDILLNLQWNEAFICHSGKNWYPIGEIHSTTHPHYMDSVFASIASPLGVSPLYNPCW